jgi:uncharacterized protein YjdB
MARLRRIASFLSSSFSLAALVVVVASCGGGGDGTTPPPGTVARVDITAPSPTMEVGQNMQVTVKYYDATSAQLSGKTVSYATSNSSVATVSNSGLITAAAPGPVTITATVDGVQGNLSITVNQVPVFFILITPTNPSVRVGETVTLTAQPQNAIGQPLTGRAVSWASADPARATITLAGVVTGVSPGTVYIRASSEGKTDSVSLRVRNLVTPSISGTSSATLVPGGSGTINGTNFGATIGDNQVIVNGVTGVVTTASTTSVTFGAGEDGAPTATGRRNALVANEDTAVPQSAPRRDRSFADGRSVTLLTADADWSARYAGQAART